MPEGSDESYRHVTVGSRDPVGEAKAEAIHLFYRLRSALNTIPASPTHLNLNEKLNHELCQIERAIV